MQLTAPDIAVISSRRPEPTSRRRTHALQLTHQLDDIKLKDVRQIKQLDRVQAPLPAFDVCDERLVATERSRHLLLREARTVSPLRQVLGQALVPR